MLLSHILEGQGFPQVGEFFWAGRFQSSSSSEANKIVVCNYFLLYPFFFFLEKILKKLKPRFLEYKLKSQSSDEDSFDSWKL